MTTKTIAAPCKPILKHPPLYKVVFFDNEISTFRSVMNIMVNYFNTTEDNAFLFAFKVDVEGNAVAGIYPRDVAETKLALAKKELKALDDPLKIELYKST